MARKQHQELHRLCSPLDSSTFADRILSLCPSQAQAQPLPRRITLQKDRSRKDTLSWLDQLGLKVDISTYSSLLAQCSHPRLLSKGRRVHSHIVTRRHLQDRFLGNHLVLMYSKCAALSDAWAVFAHMPERNVFSWNIMIGALAQNEKGKEALELFEQMMLQGVKPDKVTLISILSACAHEAAIAEGKHVHGLIVGSKFELDVVVGSALVNMYGKCGTLVHAREAFDKMPERTVFAWSAIIAAYGQHGEGKNALLLFHQMEREGVTPNEVTFVSILSACSHTGLVDEGRRIFLSMIANHGITPTEEHYNCMIDLLGRAGQVIEGEELMHTFYPSALSWITLLGACRMNVDLDQAKRAAKHAFVLDPGNAIPYKLLSSIYSAAGRWNDAEKLKKLKNIGLNCNTVCSVIDR